MQPYTPDKSSVTHIVTFGRGVHCALLVYTLLFHKQAINKQLYHQLAKKSIEGD